MLALRVGEFAHRVMRSTSLTTLPASAEIHPGDANAAKYLAATRTRMQELGIALPPLGHTSPPPPRDGTGSAGSPAAGPSGRPQHAASPPSSIAGTLGRREHAEPASSPAAAPSGRLEQRFDCGHTALEAEGAVERSAGEYARPPGARGRGAGMQTQSDRHAGGAAPAPAPGELDGMPGAASRQGNAHEAAGHTALGLGGVGSQTAPAGACLDLPLRTVPCCFVSACQ